MKHLFYRTDVTRQVYGVHRNGAFDDNIVAK